MLEGCDVSEFQGVIDWNVLKASGRVSFVIMRATFGLLGVDGQFHANQAGVRRVGIPCGYYHFAQGNDAASEARHFLATVGPLRPGETLWLDDETPPPEHNAWARAFLAALRPLVRIPGIYSNYNGFGNIGPIPDAIAWLAFPGPAPLSPPAGYTAAQTMVNQTHTTLLPGMSAGAADINYLLANSIAVFTSWGAPGGTPTPPVPEDPMFLATAGIRPPTIGQDPHGQGAIYLCEGLATQPGMFKRWVSGTVQAALPGYEARYGAVVQNFDPFTLDRMVELAPIDTTSPTLEQVSGGSGLTPDQAAAVAQIPGLAAAVSRIEAALKGA
jgi:hypothetical protein